MPHRLIAKFFAGPDLEDRDESDNKGIEVIAMFNKSGNATGFRVYVDGVQHGDDHDTAKQAISTAASVSLMQVYDWEPTVKV